MLVLLGCGSDKPAAAKQGSGVAAKAGAAPAASVAPANPSNAVAIVKSTFHTDPKFGRDPFFPGSRRDTGGSADGGSMAQLPLISYLKLFGIWPGTTRPMALINRSSFMQGESGDVSIVTTNQVNRPEAHKINIRCLEIRHDSVLISIAGEQGVKELRMAQAR
jgi:hypothetical protein